MKSNSFGCDNCEKDSPVGGMDLAAASLVKLSLKEIQKKNTAETRIFLTLESSAVVCRDWAVEHYGELVWLAMEKAQDELFED